MFAAPSRVPQALRATAKRRQAASSVTPVASGYERSLRPALTGFSHPQNVRAAGGGC